MPNETLTNLVKSYAKYLYHNEYNLERFICALYATDLNDEDVNSALMQAVVLGQTQLVDLFIRRGVNLQYRDRAGLLAITYAGFKQESLDDEYAKIVKLLLKGGSYPIKKEDFPNNLHSKPEEIQRFWTITINNIKLFKEAVAKGNSLREITDAFQTLASVETDQLRAISLYPAAYHDMNMLDARANINHRLDIPIYFFEAEQLDPESMFERAIQLFDIKSDEIGKIIQLLISAYQLGYRHPLIADTLEKIANQHIAVKATPPKRQASVASAGVEDAEAERKSAAGVTDIDTPTALYQAQAFLLDYYLLENTLTQNDLSTGYFMAASYSEVLKNNPELQQFVAVMDWLLEFGSHYSPISFIVAIHKLSALYASDNRYATTYLFRLANREQLTLPTLLARIAIVHDSCVSITEEMYSLLRRMLSIDEANLLPALLDALKVYLEFVNPIPEYHVLVINLLQEMLKLAPQPAAAAAAAAGELVEREMKHHAVEHSEIAVTLLHCYLTPKSPNYSTYVELAIDLLPYIPDAPSLIPIRQFLMAVRYLQAGDSETADMLEGLQQLFVLYRNNNIHAQNYTQYLSEAGAGLINRMANHFRGHVANPPCLSQAIIAMFSKDADFACDRLSNITSRRFIGVSPEERTSFAIGMAHYFRAKINLQRNKKEEVVADLLEASRLFHNQHKKNYVLHCYHVIKPLFSDYSALAIDDVKHLAYLLKFMLLNNYIPVDQEHLAALRGMYQTLANAERSSSPIYVKQLAWATYQLSTQVDDYQRDLKLASVLGSSMARFTLAKQELQHSVSQYTLPAEAELLKVELLNAETSYITAIVALFAEKTFNRFWQRDCTIILDNLFDLYRTEAYRYAFVDHLKFLSLLPALFIQEYYLSKSQLDLTNAVCNDIDRQHLAATPHIIWAHELTHEKQAGPCHDKLQRLPNKPSFISEYSSFRLAVACYLQQEIVPPRFEFMFNLGDQNSVLHSGAEKGIRIALAHLASCNHRYGHYDRAMLLELSAFEDYYSAVNYLDEVISASSHSANKEAQLSNQIARYLQVLIQQNCLKLGFHFMASLQQHLQEQKSPSANAGLAQIQSDDILFGKTEMVISNLPIIRHHVDAVLKHEKIMRILVASSRDMRTSMPQSITSSDLSEPEVAARAADELEAKTHQAGTSAAAAAGHSMSRALAPTRRTFNLSLTPPPPNTDEEGTEMTTFNGATTPRSP